MQSSDLEKLVFDSSVTMCQSQVLEEVESYKVIETKSRKGSLSELVSDGSQSGEEKSSTSVTSESATSRETKEEHKEELKEDTSAVTKSEEEKNEATISEDEPKKVDDSSEEGPVQEEKTQVKEE